MKINSNTVDVKNNKVLEELAERYPQLKSLAGNILSAADTIISCYMKGGKLLVCGNGGSSSDSDHIVGEMMKGFEHNRPIDARLKNDLTAIGAERGRYISEKLQQGLPAISLSAHTGLITAVANDTDPSLIFAQQVVSYGKAGDILLAISTSGNSQNVMDAVITARALGMTVIGVTGETGGRIAPLCNILINVPANGTAYVQELQIPVYHAICRIVESDLFHK